MTNTDTEDEVATAIQVAQLARTGSELVRIMVNTPEAARMVAPIRDRLDKMGCNVPLIGDFHYNGHKLLTDYPDCAAGQVPYQSGQRGPRQPGRVRIASPAHLQQPQDIARHPVRR